MAATDTETEDPLAGHQPTDEAPVDYLQDALKDLGAVREKAGEVVGANIDAVVGRISGVRQDLTSRGQGQVAEWRSGLDEAAEDVRREFGRFAVRAQRTPEALTELSQEILRRSREFSA